MRIYPSNSGGWWPFALAIVVVYGFWVMLRDTAIALTWLGLKIYHHFYPPPPEPPTEPTTWEETADLDELFPDL